MVAPKYSQNDVVLRNTKHYSYLSYISFKIVPLCNCILLTAIVNISETFLVAFYENLFSSSVSFVIMSVESQKRRPFNADFSRGNR
jgi:hypothetical protein